MAIKSNLPQPPVSILVTDTTLFQVGATYTREVITAASLHNTGLGSATVSIFESPDLTTASGIRVEVIAIDPDDRVDIDSIIAQSYSTNNLIAKASSVGTNVSITSTGYSGDS